MMTEKELRIVVRHVLQETKQNVNEIVEPFEPALISQLRRVNSELESSAYEHDAFEEISAAHTAITRLIKKLKQAPEQSFGKRPSGTRVRAAAPVAAESRKRK